MGDTGLIPGFANPHSSEPGQNDCENVEPGFNEIESLLLEDAEQSKITRTYFSVHQNLIGKDYLVICERLYGFCIFTSIQQRSTEPGPTEGRRRSGRGGCLRAG